MCSRHVSDSVANLGLAIQTKVGQIIGIPAINPLSIVRHMDTRTVHCSMEAGKIGETKQPPAHPPILRD